MEVLICVVEKVAEYTIVPIGRQAGYLIFYKDNFKMLADHVKELQSARERVSHSVEEERGKGKEIETDVMDWLKKVNEVIETANKLEQDPRRANVRCTTWGFPNLISRHQLSRKAIKTAHDVVQVQGKGTFDRVGYLPTLDVVASSSSTRGTEIYETRELLKENIVKALSDLNSCNIGVYGLGGVEHLETIDNFFSYCSTSSRSKQKYHGLEPDVSAPFFNAQVAFPKLDTLKLSSLLNLNKIWDDNYDSMYNLTSLIVDNCGWLKYLFSSTVVGTFKNLKHLEIRSCAMMEEIIKAKEEGNSASEEVQFRKLEKIILKNMDNLKTIWHRQFESLKILQVNNCNKIVVVFPSSMQKTYNKLEMLEITNCGLVEEIFELSFKESSSVEDTTHLKEVTLDGLPKLQKIWSGDPQGILSFHSLINIQVKYCASLEYLLPLSIATRCSHLKELHIENCRNMKEIVAEEKESSNVNAAPIFEFNQLSTLLLWNLIRLEGFFAKKHTLACPSLKEIDVHNCPKLTLYRTKSTRSSIIRDDKLSVSMEQPLFIVEEVIPNLEKLRINHKEANVIQQAQNSSGLFTKMTCLVLYDYKDEDTLFPYWFLQNVCGLKKLVIVQSCFKKIFQDEGRMSEKTRTQIKELTLDALPNLEHICEEGFQIDSVLELLEYLWVESCPSLINLLPSSVTFTHLVQLDIKDCNGLTKLITSSTAQSLINLTTLKIEACNSLEEIILGEENVHITFISLEILILVSLPSLNQFGSSKCFFKFPLLEVAIVRECPRMKVFSEGYTSTPNLRKVKIAENDEEWCWKGNLNDTIKNMFEDKVAFGKFKYLALSDYPEMKDLWYGQLDHQNVFCNLKHLVIDNCGVEQIVAKEEGSMEHSFNFPQLNKLILNYLENLTGFYCGKHSLDCPSLKELNVYGCAFNHLDWFSIEKLSRNLEKLTINGTDLLEILNQENIFQKVETLYLQCLDETPATFLNEYSHTIFPNLETFQVRNSFFETLFPTTGYLNMQTSKQIRILTLFELEMLKHVWQEDFPLDHPLLQDLDELCVLHCPSLISLVPSLTSFTNLTYLAVDNCKELLYLITSSTAKSLVQLKRLEISNCEKMLDVVKIDDEKAEEDIIFENLEDVEFTSLSSLGSFCYGNQTFIFPSLQRFIVKECPQMEIFSSGVTIAPYLTEIEVEEETIQCKGDINTTIQQLFLEKEVLRSNALNETIIS
ncbi:hypothetical protein QL285_001814 [Trifolium repens]|nr:hypothetical protein QL285_001814 [Trifolium repens]